MVVALRDRAAVRRVRLASSGLTRLMPTATDVVRHFVAIQGQDWTAARWALGLRVDGTTASTIAAEFASGSIVRSWPMRGTLHMVSARDLGWVQALTGDRVLRDAPKRRETIGLSLDTIERVRGIVIDALRGGRALSRAELWGVVEEAGLDVQGPQRYHTIWYLAQTGTIVMGPVRGNEQLFVLTEEWITDPREYAGDEALAQLFFAYARGHGPVSVHDFAWWTKLSVTVARRAAAAAVDAFRDELVPVEVGGVAHWACLSALDCVEPGAEQGPAAGDGEALRLLPGFDEYYLGVAERGAMIDEAHAARLAPGNNGMFLPAVLINGEIVATWRRGGDSGVETIDWFDGRAKASKAQLDAASRRVREFWAG